MKLHLDKVFYKEMVLLTSHQMNIPAQYVEKDYWVTYILYTIFHDEIGKETIFKGGTALAKCYNLIERFSEDIDLVVLKHEGESNNKLTTKIRTITDVVDAVLPEINVESITNKKGNIRKTAHTYNKDFGENYGQVRDAIIVEATWLGYFEPYTTRPVCSFVGKIMLDNKQAEIAATHGLLPFEVRVLEPIRTMCEKIMSLVRFSYTENAIVDLKNKIRHTYDLHQLLQQKEFSNFFDSKAFDAMLLKVANDDMVSFKNNNQWLIYHPSEALMFKDLEKVWNELKTAYNGEFKNLVYGKLPNERDILETLKKIKDRLTHIVWSIKIT